MSSIRPFPFSQQMFPYVLLALGEADIKFMVTLTTVPHWKDKQKQEREKNRKKEKEKERERERLKERLDRAKKTGKEREREREIE